MVIGTASGVGSTSRCLRCKRTRKGFIVIWPRIGRLCEMTCFATGILREGWQPADKMLADLVDTMRQRKEA